MPRMLIPATLEFLFATNSTFALVDVREYGEYNTAHIPGSSSLPRRLLEFRFERLVPGRSVQVIVCDDDGSRAALAAATIEQAGYTRVAVLDGGVNRWATEGRPTEWGMNVVSKDFGERVEVQHHVPTIDPLELHRRQKSGQSLVILDTRTPEEFHRACIPGGRSVPGGELAFRITDIIRDRPDATIVVNCAGRTRSIIGARTLQRMGVPNVVSLRNGTSGWTLAGLELEHGSTRLALPPPTTEGRSAAEAFALRVAEEDGVRFLDVTALSALMADHDQRPVYLIDVRDRSEFEAGHIAGFWWFPGGQAVQRADDVAAVRNAAIVFCCDGIARAAITASWYRQIGFPNVYAVRGGTSAWTEAGNALETGPAELETWGVGGARDRVGWLTPGDLRVTLSTEHAPVLLFVGTSDEFAHAHIPGSQWICRSWLEIEIGECAPDLSQRIVVTDAGGTGAVLAAATLAQIGYEHVSALDEGMSMWLAAGLPVEHGLAGIMHPPADVVAAGPDRTYADMIHYLAWEEALGGKYSAS